MDDPVLNGYVATNDPGDDHAARVRTVPDDRVRPDHDRVLAVVVLKVNEIVRRLIQKSYTVFKFHLNNGLAFE